MNANSKKFSDYLQKNYSELSKLYNRIYHTLTPDLINIKNSAQEGLRGERELPAFMSKEIKKIVTTQKEFLTGFLVECVYENITIKLNIYGVEPREHEESIRKILLRLITFCKFLKNEIIMEVVSVNIWLTNVKKMLPSVVEEVITEDHVNSGSTLVSKNTGLGGQNSIIYIWRKEELLKVLLHECIHAFGIDNKLIWDAKAADYNKQFRETFCIDNEFATVNEIYAELMATIYNSMFVLLERRAFGNSNQKISIKSEQIHSIEQMSKILHHYGYKQFSEIFRNKEGSGICKKFPQKTNVMSYYVMKACFLNNPSAMYKFLVEGIFDVQNICKNIELIPKKSNDNKHLKMVANSENVF